jgi:hypothetical protein
MISVGCTSQPVVNQSASTAEVSVDTVAVVPPPVAAPQASPNLLPSTTSPPTLPVPSLIPPTSLSEHLPQVSVGRSDPFSAIASAPIISATSTSVPAIPQPLPAVPIAANPSAPLPVISVPQPTLLPAPTDINQIPTAPVQGTPPINRSDEILVSGVVQIGDRLSAIVELPGEGISRYVSVGDTLANGRIVIRRIEMNENQEPRVILLKDGVEIVKTVGGVT